MFTSLMTSEDVHVSTAIDEYVRDSRELLALIDFSIAGALARQDHDLPNALNDALTDIGRRLAENLAGLEAVAERIREFGAPSVADNLKAHPEVLGELAEPESVRERLLRLVGDDGKAGA